MGTDITFLSGLPRTGSTLLTSILGQNPRVNPQPNSALCQVLWDMHLSFMNPIEMLVNRPDIPDKMMKAIPEIFYQGYDGHIIDKCRTWTLPANVDLVKKYINPNPKMIVMTRPIVDIVKSFVYIRSVNGWADPEMQLLEPNTAPIMIPIEALKYAREDDQSNYIFIKYDDLITDTKSVIDSLYDFLGWEKYEHYYSNIKNLSKEKDDLISLSGLHEVRPNIHKRELDVTLSPELFEKAQRLDEELGLL
jgi:sulfotransferase